jgi:hypothetical protein
VHCSSSDDAQQAIQGMQGGWQPCFGAANMHPATHLPWRM